ncbi:MAG: HipA N-terminal domain-containing protein [Ignavibacteriae bacterium]|nr:HipA N-terminal domain-containing protein [Ignavibacteriota bacterium]MCB9208473.1 HipA N-terminal domain-containing protein [Ignavibacteriales bacterium]MCB9258418.1 HipA N-terminal domain-containing protein [Ignavibacteriales bacterium]
MKKAKIYNFGKFAGILSKIEFGYEFEYDEEYSNEPISLSMPIQHKKYSYKNFPPFFDGLLPEGNQLDALLRQTKIDRNDYLSQLIKIGQDLVGSVTVESFE